LGTAVVVTASSQNPLAAERARADVAYSRGLLRLTQLCGEFEDLTRSIWVRGDAITHFTLWTAWRNPGMGSAPRGTLLHLSNGETCSVTEPPELIAAWLRRQEESAP
jgi:hypothetical protein